MMANGQNHSGINDANFEWLQLLGKLGVTAAGYPFEYVKVLIQIGHEPIPPRPTRTLLGRPALALPGVFTYMKHIKKVDGFWGLYRGLWPKLCTNIFSMSTYGFVYEKIPNFNTISKDNPQRELTDEQKIIVNCLELIRISIARGITLIVSHPFHVITVRTIAQFVGREEVYGGVFGSIREVYRQDGVLGFFYGLIPRLLGELLALWTAATASVLINTYLVEEETLKTYVTASMNYLANTLYYPFQVVSHVSIVNDCGLKVGMPGNMPVYSNWMDCWSHLRAIGQLKRGTSILWRYYSGPYMSPVFVTSSSRRAYAQAFPYSSLKF